MIIINKERLYNNRLIIGFKQEIALLCKQKFILKTYNFSKCSITCRIQIV
jgi:hypothetical protein